MFRLNHCDGQLPLGRKLGLWPVEPVIYEWAGLARLEAREGEELRSPEDPRFLEDSRWRGCLGQMLGFRCRRLGSKLLERPRGFSGPRHFLFIGRE